MTEMSPLRRRMIEDMTVRNLSPATQRSYVHAVAKFGRFFGRSPEKLDLEDVRAFQVHLVAGGMSWPALNQTVCALRFLYGVTLARPDLPERIAHAREPQKLPVVLSADEVVRFLEAVPSLKSRAALTTAYAAGLRASEAVSLKVANIDSGRMVIRVEQGKSLPLRRRGVGETVTSCSRRNCSPSCAPIGGWRVPGTGCSQAVTANIRSTRRCCTPPAARPAPPPG
jgi:integrase/recombinase XerD